MEMFNLKFYLIFSVIIFAHIALNSADMISNIEQLTSIQGCHLIFFYQTFPGFPIFKTPLSIWKTNFEEENSFPPSNFSFPVERTRQIDCFSLISVITELTYKEIEGHQSYNQVYNCINWMSYNSQTFFKDNAVVSTRTMDRGKVAIIILLQSAPFNELGPNSQQELLHQTISEDILLYQVRILIIVRNADNKRNSAYTVWDPPSLASGTDGPLFLQTDPKLPNEISAFWERFRLNKPLKYHANLPHIQDILSTLNISYLPGIEGPSILEGALDQPYLEYNVKQNIIPVETSSFRFLTCHSEPELSFEFYLKPFQWQVWVAIILSVLLIVAFLHFYGILNPYPTSFSPVFQIIGILLEEALSAPSTLLKSQPFRIVLISWLLMSIILTNAYIGVAITDLSSPLKLKSISKFEHLKTTQCQTGCDCGEEFGYYETNYTRYLTALDRRIFKMGTHFEWVSKFENQVNPKLGHLSNFEFGNVLEPLKARLVLLVQSLDRNCLETPKFVMDQFYLLSLFFPKRGYLPDLKNGTISVISAIERKLVSCGRTVFILKSKELEAEYKFLHGSYKNLTFFKSDVTLSTILIVIMTFDGSDTPGKIVRLLETGIYSKIRTKLDFITFLERFNNFTWKNSRQFLRTVKPISMFGSVQTIFIIYVIFVGISLAAGGGEISWRNRVRIYHSLRGKVRGGRDIVWEKIMKWIELMRRVGIIFKYVVLRQQRDMSRHPTNMHT